MLLDLIVLVVGYRYQRFDLNKVYRHIWLSSVDIVCTFFNTLKLYCCRTEKNACAWSQEKLKELFVNSKIEGEGGW